MEERRILITLYLLTSFESESESDDEALDWDDWQVSNYTSIDTDIRSASPRNPMAMALFRVEYFLFFSFEVPNITTLYSCLLGHVEL